VTENSHDASFDETTAVLTVRGDIDEDAGVALRENIAATTQNYTRSIAIDLTEVDYFPSLAVGVVARALAKARESGIELVLRAAPGTVAQRVLTVCGLEHQTV
jgi:anti-anti-sigma factor